MATITSTFTKQDIRADEVANKILAATDHADSRSEQAVHDLVQKLREYKQDQLIGNEEYELVMARAAETLKDYNYDITYPAAQAETSLRSVIIDQVGRSILKGIYVECPVLVGSEIYDDAVKGLGVGKSMSVMGESWTQKITEKHTQNRKPKKSSPQKEIDPDAEIEADLGTVEVKQGKSSLRDRISAEYGTNSSGVIRF